MRTFKALAVSFVGSCKIPTYGRITDLNNWNRLSNFFGAGVEIFILVLKVWVVRIVGYIVEVIKICWILHEDFRHLELTLLDYGPVYTLEKGFFLYLLYCEAAFSIWLYESVYKLLGFVGKFYCTWTLVVFLFVRVSELAGFDPLFLFLKIVVARKSWLTCKDLVG